MVTTHTPVMGPNLLSAAQLARWFNSVHGGTPPNVPSLHDNVTALAQTFIDEGRIEGVRGDIAFVQSILETGWFSFADSQIPPDANNFAGINAFDGRPGLPNCKHGDSTPSRGASRRPRIGVLNQIQLLRSYADATTKHLPHRLISAPSDRVGRRADLGVLRRQQLPVRQAHLGEREELRHHDLEAVLRGARVQRRERGVRAVRARATTRRTPATATGWRPTSRTCTRSASRTTTAIPASLHLNKPLIGGESLVDRQRATGCSASTAASSRSAAPSSTARPADGT